MTSQWDDDESNPRWPLSVRLCRPIRCASCRQLSLWGRGAWHGDALPPPSVDRGFGPWPEPPSRCLKWGYFMLGLNCLSARCIWFFLFDAFLGTWGLTGAMWYFCESSILRDCEWRVFLSDLLPLQWASPSWLCALELQARVSWPFCLLTHRRATGLPGQNATFVLREGRRDLGCVGPASGRG